LTFEQRVREEERAHGAMWIKSAVAWWHARPVPGRARKLVLWQHRQDRIVIFAVRGKKVLNHVGFCTIFQQIHAEDEVITWI
jgi:hypothetical protein